MRGSSGAFDQLPPCMRLPNHVLRTTVIAYLHKPPAKCHQGRDSTMKARLTNSPITTANSHRSQSQLLGADTGAEKSTRRRKVRAFLPLIRVSLGFKEQTICLLTPNRKLTFSKSSCQKSLAKRRVKSMRQLQVWKWSAISSRRRNSRS